MMKKTLLALAVSAASGVASADTILGFYAGAGSWQASYDGVAGDDDSLLEPIDVDELGIDDSDNTFFYAALEHPVPLIPNIRLARSNVQVEANSTIETTFRLDDVTFTAYTPVFTELDLTHTDATFYYEILDNWVSFDLGITARQFDGRAFVQSTDDPTMQEEVELDDVIPLLYAKAQFELPLTGWRLAAGGNYVSYSGDSFSDLDAKIGYATDGLVLDFGIDVGYRRMNLDVNQDDGMTADVTVDGPYVEATLHF